MPRKAARLNGSTGITSSSRNPIDRLPSYKRTYVKARAEGKSIKESAAEAGIAAITGHRYDKDADIQKAYRHLMQLAISPEKLVKLVRGGCEAKMPVFSSQGQKTGERADWKTRRPYIEMASKHAGYYEEKNSAVAGASITLVVNHIGNKQEKPAIEATIQDNG